MSRKYKDHLDETEPPHLIKIGKWFGITIEVDGRKMQIKDENMWKRRIPYTWGEVSFNYCVNQWAFPEEPDKWYGEWIEGSW
jgi:hypothetical protein